VDYSKGVEPVTVLKSRSAELISVARETGRPIVITQNGRPTAVLQDVESFRRQREALALLKMLARGDGELRDGKGIDHERVMDRFESKIKALQRG